MKSWDQKDYIGVDSDSDFDAAGIIFFCSCRPRPFRKRLADQAGLRVMRSREHSPMPSAFVEEDRQWA